MKNEESRIKNDDKEQRIINEEQRVKNKEWKKRDIFNVWK